MVMNSFFSMIYTNYSTKCIIWETHTSGLQHMQSTHLQY